MDPNAALAALRGHLAEVDTVEPHDVRALLDDLAEKVSGLDEWLSKGGFPPEAWVKVRPEGAPVPPGTVDPQREVPEAEFKALVTIEAMERMVRRVQRVLALGRPISDADRAFMAGVLEEAADLASARTCTAVKSQSLSDEISKQAGAKVDTAVHKVRDEQMRALRERNRA